ncbi:dUTP diphosphatase [Candidatus Dependentiae bacterium]|nr:dUTP diphosphatase [Candidatus Dependentiae bacterium]
MEKTLINKDKILLQVEKLEHARNLSLPKYMTEDSSGFDLLAGVADDILIQPGERALVPTGLKFMIPHGFEGQVRPRSGLAVKFGVTVLNTPGTIDADYRGEVKVILYNAGKEEFTVHRGDRIAQLVISPVQQVILKEVKSVSKTLRNENGFGSTGK